MTATLDAIRRHQARREEALNEVDEPKQQAMDRRRAPRSPELVAADRQMIERAAQELATMSENRRRAVGLYIQGFGTRDVAELLGWTEPKARNLIYRGLDELRSRLVAHRPKTSVTT